MSVSDMASNSICCLSARRSSVEHGRSSASSPNRATVCATPPTGGRHMRRRLLLAGVFAASIAMCAVGMGTARADDAAWKAAHDTDPHIPLTPYQQQMRAQKIQAIADRAAASGQPVAANPEAPAGAAVLPDGAATTAAPSAASVAANQVAQLTSYWCGPAAEKE